MCSPATSYVNEQMDRLDRMRSTRGEHHPDVADALNTLALFHNHALRDKETSLRLHTQALRILRKSQVLAQVAITLTDMGDIHRSMGDFEKALSSYAEALDIFRETDLPDTHPGVYAATRGAKFVSRDFSSRENDTTSSSSSDDSMVATNEARPEDGSACSATESETDSSQENVSPNSQEPCAVDVVAQEESNADASCGARLAPLQQDPAGLHSNTRPLPRNSSSPIESQHMNIMTVENSVEVHRATPMLRSKASSFGDEPKDFGLGKANSCPNRSCLVSNFYERIKKETADKSVICFKRNTLTCSAA